MIRGIKNGVDTVGLHKSKTLVWHGHQCSRWLLGGDTVLNIHMVDLDCINTARAVVTRMFMNLLLEIKSLHMDMASSGLPSMGDTCAADVSVN